MSERHPTPPPDPAGAAGPAEFAQRLRTLRLWAGEPSLRRLRQLGGTTVDERGNEIDALPVSTLSHVLRENRLPRMEFVRAFVTACLRARGRDPATIAAELERWHEAWLGLHGDPPPTPAVAAPAAGPVPRQLPSDVVGFAGRVDEIASLTKALAESGRTEPAAIAVISGPGGVGKSALAIRVAHQLVGEAPDGQLYVDLHGATAGLTPLAPLEVLHRFLRALGVTGGDLPDQVDEAAGRFRTVVADRRLLLVLDNAADSGQVRPLLPGTPRGRVLVTSRQPLLGLEGAYHLRLDLLPEPDAVGMLARTIGADRVSAEPQAAEEVVRRCGHLPLALRVVAARLVARPAWPVAIMAQRLADQQRRLDELQTGEAGVRASFDVSYHQLRGSDDPADHAAARAFGLIGVWDGPDLPLPAAARLLDLPEPEAEPLLERLVDAQLLETRSPGRYRMHDLLRLYARELAIRVYPEPERTARLASVLRFYVGAAWQTLALLRPGAREPADPRWTGAGPAFANRADAVSWLEAERANLLSAALQAAASEELAAAAVQLALALPGFLEAYHYWPDSDLINETALAVTRRNQDLAGEAYVHLALAGGYFHRGLNQETATHAKAALVMLRQLGDLDGQASSLINLGIAYQRLRRDEDAHECLQEALSICRSRGDGRGEARTLINLGTVLKSLGRLEEALDRCRESLAITRELGDRDLEALNLNNLGMGLGQLGRHDEALRYLELGLETYQELGNRAGVAMCLDSLGVLHHKQGRYEQALDCFRRSLRVCRELGLRREEVEVLRNLGMTLQALGRTEEARARWTEALAICEELQLPTDDLRAMAGMNQV